MADYTVADIDELRDAIRLINLEDNDSTEYVIELDEANFPSFASISESPSMYGDANLFGDCAFPIIYRNTKIIGQNQTIQANGCRHFAINGKLPGYTSTNAKLTLEGLNLIGGSSGSGGGSIVNDGSSAAPGGASLVIRNCYFGSNQATTNGGMLYNGDDARCQIFDSIIKANEALGNDARGGAIYNSSGADLFIRRTTFAGNEASDSGSLGGAIFIYSGTVDVKNSSFVENIADADSTPAMTLYNYSGSFDATWNWWGSVAPVTPPTPYLSNLPQFVRAAGYNSLLDNPSLPDASSIFITNWGTAEVRSGPNAMDDYKALSNDGSELPLALRAQATDEDSNVWVGFSHPERPDYLSWARFSDVVLSSSNISALPDFSTQPDTNYGNSLLISHSPLERYSSTRDFKPTNWIYPDYTRQKGFGWVDQSSYPTYPGYSHSGIDFFADSSMNVLAVTGGIVVGIGTDESSAPGSWGAADSGAGQMNLIIRTEGYFLMYGHMGEIHPSLYIGARVGPGAVLGKPAAWSGNTHVHLEVRMFTEEQMDGTYPSPIRCCFGEIVRYADDGGLNYHPKPKLAVDPMKFINVRGTSTYSSTTLRRTYEGAQLLLDDQVVTFDYEVQDTLDQKAFELGVNSLAVTYPVPDPAGPQHCPWS